MLFRKILLIIWIVIAILLAVNVLFLANILDSNILVSRLGRYIAQDQQIDHFRIFLLVIQGELLLAFFAISYFLKKGEKNSPSILSTVSLFICFVMLVLSFILYKSYDSEFLWSLYREDHFFENLTALLHLVSSFLFLLLIVQNWKKKTSSIILLLLFGSFFFVGMEEISWGQRLFGIQTPRFLKEINTLDETNIHNILSLSSREYVYTGFFMLMGIVFILRGFIEKKFKKWGVARGILPFLPPADFFYFGVLIFAMLLVHNYFVDWEVFEQIFAVIGTTYALHVYLGFKKGASVLDGKTRDAVGT